MDPISVRLLSTPFLELSAYSPILTILLLAYPFPSNLCSVVILLYLRSALVPRIRQVPPCIGSISFVSDLRLFLVLYRPIVLPFFFRVTLFS